MADDIYERMYLRLFNAITDVMENHRDEPELAFSLLEAAQLDSASMYREHMSAFEAKRTLLGGIYYIEKKKTR